MTALNVIMWCAAILAVMFTTACGLILLAIVTGGGSASITLNKRDK